MMTAEEYNDKPTGSNDGRDAPELKPCPFCGGKATRQVNNLPNGGTTYETGCNNVGCLVTPSAMQLCTSYANKNWNTRATDTRLADAEEMAEALRFADEVFRDMGWHAKWEVTSAALEQWRAGK